MKYTPEEKRQLVMRYQNGESVSHICSETGISRSTFYSWVKPYQTTLTETGVLVTPQEFALLKRRVEKLESIINVLKSVDCTVSSPLKEKLAALETLYGQYSIHTLCDALEVSRGTFYNYIFRNKRDNSSYARRREELSRLISEIYDENRQIFGPEKIRAILTDRGYTTSKKYVAELMHELGLTSMSPSSKKEYKHLNEAKAKRNILNRNFNAEHMNQIWISDITCFKLKQKYYYICVIMDLFSRKIISYKIRQKQSAQLITSTFKQAYAERSPKKGLIFHSDRGIQYTASSFQQLLVSCGVEQSFSNTGRPHDNAVAEAFFSGMKREELYRRNYQSEADFKRSVDEYIIFYNTKRPHSALNYRCPDQIEETALNKLLEGK